MKHNTILLMIFIPIVLYQIYYTFRYWKEGLDNSQCANDKDPLACCARNCKAKGYCCNDPNIGSNQFISCSQACKMSIENKLDNTTCKSKCKSQAGKRGCSYSDGKVKFSMCSSCKDLTNDPKCKWGTGKGESCPAGCDIAGKDKEPKAEPQKLSSTKKQQLGDAEQDSENLQKDKMVAEKCKFDMPCNSKIFLDDMAHKRDEFRKQIGRDPTEEEIKKLIEPGAKAFSLLNLCKCVKDEKKQDENCIPRDGDETLAQFFKKKCSESQLKSYKDWKPPEEHLPEAPNQPSEDKLPSGPIAVSGQDPQVMKDAVKNAAAEGKDIAGQALAAQKIQTKYAALGGMAVQSAIPRPKDSKYLSGVSEDKENDAIKFHEASFHAQNGKKASNLDGSNIKGIEYKTKNMAWCIPHKNKKGKIIFWIAKPNKKMGWNSKDKCLSMKGGKPVKIHYGTGRCIKRNTKEECEKALNNLSRDAYWHKHPVLMGKLKQKGPKATAMKFI